MIDASKGFRKDGPKNRLREQDLHRIVDTFTKQIDITGYSRMVPVAEISDSKNDYSLNLPRYIDSTEAEDLQDIEGHLRGGIPNCDLDELKAYWQVIPAVRSVLFKEDRPGYCRLCVATSDIKPTILAHPEFTTFNAKATKLFADWKEANTSLLKGFNKGGHPKVLIESISKSLLEAFQNFPLLDCYDIYQHLMDFWDRGLQDDCYLISTDGWMESAQPRPFIEEKGKKNKVDVDFIVGKKKYAAELIPSALIIARYFANEQTAIDQIESQLSALEQQLEEMEEEHGGEGGLLEEAKNEKDKLTKTSATARLKEIKADKDVDEERKSLQDYLALVELESDANARIKAAQEALFTKVLAKYSQLSEDDIKTLVVEDKWITTLAVAVNGELDRVSQTLTGRIRELAERYAIPLPQITDNVETLSNRVNEHLKKMGITWN
jgi:type I restriction enzyme M protein